ncbi:hypothetical protein P43SY_000538 [Pythium insidiosum]|uniref:Cilia- and flagella-associated protein 251 n=1 Tax=Pythium insidiosum TaxID=114742 RepID=A0AAD5Q212_PYTIN|nr:hypothetical protein P43SY_000538 [Pythium insidiosum]
MFQLAAAEHAGPAASSSHKRRRLDALSMGHDLFQVKIELSHATDLLAADPTGTSDPYVIFRIRNDRRRSTVRDRTCHPVWKPCEVIELFVRNPEEQVLQVEVFDHDRFSADDPLGHVAIPLSKFLRQQFTEESTPLQAYRLDPPVSWFKGKCRSAIHIGVSVVPVPLASLTLDVWENECRLPGGQWRSGAAGFLIPRARWSSDDGSTASVRFEDVIPSTPATHQDSEWAFSVDMGDAQGWLYSTTFKGPWYPEPHAFSLREFPLPRASLPTVEVSTEEYLMRKFQVDCQVQALVREYEQFKQQRCLDRRVWKKVGSRGHLQLFRQRRDRQDITPLSQRRPVQDATHDLYEAEKDEDVDRASNFTGDFVETPGTPILMERRRAASSTSPPAGSDRPPLLMIGECVGTVEHALTAVVCESREDMALSSQFIHKSVADCALLQTLESPTSDEPFRYLAYKWVVQHSPTSSRLIKHRDAVYLEHTSVTTTASGERLGVVLTESVDVPMFPELHERRCVRMWRSTRVVFRQRTPSVVEIFASGDVRLGGRLMASLASRAAAEMLYAVGRLPECGEVKTLTLVARQLRGERRSMLLTVPPTLSVCALCRASPLFLDEGILGRFHRARCCKTCVKIAALPTTDRWRPTTSSVTSLGEDSGVEAVGAPLRPSELMVPPKGDVGSGDPKRSATRAPRKTVACKQVTFAEDMETDDVFYALTQARAPAGPLSSREAAQLPLAQQLLQLRERVEQTYNTTKQNEMLMLDPYGLSAPRQTNTLVMDEEPIDAQDGHESSRSTESQQPEPPANAPEQAPGASPSNNPNALRLAWSFGFNKDLVNGVHNLTTDDRRAVFYTAAHTGVIYDYAQRQQKLLQGHCHPITSCVVSEDKRWIVTADRGPESMIVIWDAFTGNPIKTIFQPHRYGVQAIDISPDALFLVTLSAVEPATRGDTEPTNADQYDDEEEEPGSPKKSKTNKKDKTRRFQQELAVWEWTSPTVREGPLYSSLVATEDLQHAVRFNTYDIREIVTNGKQRVIFWSWAEQRLLFYSPSLSQRDFRQVIGNFTQSLFVPDSQQALTGTEDGDLVLWDVLRSTDAETTRFPDRKATKIVRLAGGSEVHKKVAITYITDMDGYLVLGSSDGAVRFYDFDFRLVAWFEDLNAGPVMSISFAATNVPSLGTQSPPPRDRSGSRRTGSAAQDAANDDDFFQVPDFIVATSSAFIVGLSASLFAEHASEKRRGTLLMQGINDEIHGLATHPRYAQLAISSYSGVLQLWDYSVKRLIMMRRFEVDKLRPQCLAFSPEGKRLFVGFTSGLIKILHAQRLEDITMLRLSKVAITDIRISADASLFVAVDANQFMGMWRARGNIAIPASSEGEGKNNDDDVDVANDWTYIGRCRAHAKPITGIEFFQSGDGQPLLVSVAEDKTMVEYCLTRSSIVDGIVLTQSPVKIEQSARPTACCWHPEMKSLHEDMLIIANDEYKLKQWNSHNKSCRKTTLGPSYGGPINRLVPLPLRPGLVSNDAADGHASNGVPAERYCAYSTHEKVVGLLKLPLDGNPHKSMGLIAHPGEISNIDVSHDGHYLVTAGGQDMVINLWEIHTNELDAVEASVGDGLDPFLSLLEGGKDGAFYHEIVDYFYFAQLRVQGENATAAREITAQIPLAEIPNVMRALGYYPTEQEIQHMWSEVKYSQFTQTTQSVESIDLRDFIKLYVNHRPVFGIGKQDIERAFSVLGANPSLRWDLLRKRLLHMGEQMTEDELRSCLEALLVGTNEEDDGAAPSLDSISMSMHYTADGFAEKVLGFDDYVGDEDDAAPLA